MLEGLKKMFGFSTPAVAGESESTMSESSTQATTPAASGVLTLEQVQQAIAAALAPVTETITKLGESQVKLQEGLDGVAKTASASAVNPEELAKLVNEQLATQAKTQAEADAANAGKKALRQKVVEARLKGVPESLLATLPDTADEAALTAAADGLRKTLEALPGVKLEDVGGVANEGGTPADKIEVKPGFLRDSTAAIAAAPAVVK